NQVMGVKAGIEALAHGDLKGAVVNLAGAARWMGADLGPELQTAVNAIMATDMASSALEKFGQKDYLGGFADLVDAGVSAYHTGAEVSERLGEQAGPQTHRIDWEGTGKEGMPKGLGGVIEENPGWGQQGSGLEKPGPYLEHMA